MKKMGITRPCPDGGVMTAVNLVTEEGVTPQNTEKKPLQSLQIVE